MERAIERKPVTGYLPAPQAKVLLQAADAKMLLCVAIQLFAELRSCEMAELNFEQIDLARCQLWEDKAEHTTRHASLRPCRTSKRGCCRIVRTRG